MLIFSTIQTNINLYMFRTQFLVNVEDEFERLIFHDTCEFTETRAVTQRVMKGCHIVVHPRSSPEISVDGTSLANHKEKKSNNP